MAEQEEENPIKCKFSSCANSDRRRQIYGHSSWEMRHERWLETASVVALPTRRENFPVVSLGKCNNKKSKLSHSITNYFPSTAHSQVPQIYRRNLIKNFIVQHLIAIIRSEAELSFAVARTTQRKLLRASNWKVFRPQQRTFNLHFYQLIETFPSAPLSVHCRITCWSRWGWRRQRLDDDFWLMILMRQYVTTLASRDWHFLSPWVTPVIKLFMKTNVAVNEIGKWFNLFRSVNSKLSNII